MKTFYEGWDCKEDMARDFNIDLKELDGVEVLFAWYTGWCYEGEAAVVFRKDGKLYEVHGSHCSCYGLEGQWEPEETSVEALKYRFENGNFGYFFDQNSELKDAFSAMLNSHN